MSDHGTSAIRAPFTASNCHSSMVCCNALASRNAANVAACVIPTRAFVMCGRLSGASSDALARTAATRRHRLHPVPNGMVLGDHLSRIPDHHLGGTSRNLGRAVRSAYSTL